VRAHGWPRPALVLSLALILGLTLWPYSASAELDPAWCISCPRSSARDVILNIGLFVPFGVVLAQSGRAWYVTTATAALLSLAIEGAQWQFIAGRQASWLDVFANALGAFLGHQVARRGRRLLEPQHAAGIAMAGAVAWAVQCGVVAVLMRWDVPETPAYWGQWSHVFAGTERFPGRVTGFRVNDVDIYDDVVQATGALRRSMAREGIGVRLTVVEGGPVATRAQMAGLTDGEGNLLVGMAQVGCSYQLIARVRGERYGFTGPSSTVPLPCEPGASAVLTGRLTSAIRELTVHRGTVVQRATRELRPSEGWSLLAPPDLPLAAVLVVSLGWSLLFFAPIAWAIGGADVRSVTALGLYLGATAGSYAVVRQVAAMALPGYADWLALMAGACLVLYRNRWMEREVRRKMSHMAMDIAT
jgi:hypothetical protein